MRLSSSLPSRRARRALSRSVAVSVAVSVACSGALGVHAARRMAAPVTLKFASWDPAAVTNLFINPCAKKLGYNVVNQLVPYANYGTKVQTEFAAGTAPDLFYGLEDHTLAWGASGQLLDQAAYFKALHVSTADILPQSLWWNHGQPGGKLVGVGVAAEDMFLYYNKAVFAQAGVAAPPSDAAHAWTWDQFVAVARKLTMDRHGKHPGQPGFDTRHIVRYGANVGNSWTALLPFVYSNGGMAYDSTYKHFTLGQPAAVAAVQAVADLAIKEHVAPTPVQMTATSGALTLASGRLAMSISGNWDIYFQQNPKKTYSMGIGVLPKFKTYKTIVVGGPLVVWSHTKYPKEAMQMVNCINNNSQALWQNGIWMPVTKKQYDGSALTAWAKSDAHPSNYISVGVDTLKYAEDAPEIKTAQFNASWVDVVQPALDQIFTGRKTARDALSAITPRVDAILSQGR